MNGVSIRRNFCPKEVEHAQFRSVAMDNLRRERRASCLINKLAHLVQNGVAERTLAQPAHTLSQSFSLRRRFRTFHLPNAFFRAASFHFIESVSVLLFQLLGV